jgi:hypothetical protein
MRDSVRHGVAEIGMAPQLQGDDQLFQALVSGCHIENAASIAGVSVRTAYRRLADPTFRSQLQDARQNIRESILAKLSDAGHDAVGTLWELMETAEDESVRLRAAKAVLDSLKKLRLTIAQGGNHNSHRSRANHEIDAEFARKERLGHTHVFFSHLTRKMNAILKWH